MKTIRLKLVRYFILGGLLSFVLFLFISLVSRSQNRSSILGPTAVFTAAQGDQSVATNVQDASSKLHLQEFHRVEVKDGRPVWEVRASEAKHFPEDNLIHVNQAALTVYRRGESPIEVRSKAARLLANGASLTKAVLEGEIAVHVDESVEISTDLATFDVAEQVITAPEHVVIKGPGYQIQGDGLRFLVDSKQFEFSRNVQSEFDQGAKGPRQGDAWK